VDHGLRAARPIDRPFRKGDLSAAPQANTFHGLATFQPLIKK